ncbi:DUF262 domain-containing protein [Rhodococcus sp. NPDC019627]|nr:DUF262 domain-containing protein [Rhodococcus opacus]
MQTSADLPDPDVIDESVTDDEGLVDLGDSTLSYLGADFDVAGLVRRLEQGDIVVPRFDPDESAGSEISGFQRQGVWTPKKMEQFIESLLLGWPVPSIFLVLEPDQRYLVLDGQQRLTALESFYKGKYPNGREFSLNEVAEHLQGATYETLNSESRRRLNNTFIQATVIEPKGPDGRESIYRLFGRLNSGGVSLTAQEIRVALYRGPVVDWIRDLNHDENWRRLFGPAHKRLKDHELILRSLALLRAMSTSGSGNGETSAYRPPMSDFLNNYLKDNRDLKSTPTAELSDAFAKSTSALVAASGSNALRYSGTINAAHVDATLANLMSIFLGGGSISPSELKKSLDKLRDSEEYRAYVTRSTSHRDSVNGRLSVARSIFSEAAEL